MTNTDFVLKDIPLNLVPEVAAAIEEILNTNRVDEVPFAEPPAEKPEAPKKRKPRAKKEVKPAPEDEAPAPEDEAPAPEDEAPAPEDEAPAPMPVDEFRDRLRAVVDKLGGDDKAQRRALAVFKDVAGEKAVNVKTLPEEHRAEVIKLLEGEVDL